MKKKQLKNFVNEEFDNFLSEFDDDNNLASTNAPITRDSDNEDLNNFRGATIEVRGEGSRQIGKIIQVKENKNGIIIMFKNKWNEIEELNLYFDEFEELQANKVVHTMDGEIVISK